MSIHPTAIIEPGAELHPSVAVGPYSIIESGAVLGEGCVVESCTRIYGHTRLGCNNRVCHGVTLGAEPQDLGYTPEQAKPLTIGDDNQFREGVNISHGVKSATGTRIGSRNFFMAYSHVGHDCSVGDDNVFANTATLAGHVELAHHVFVSGQVAVHQFCRIGAYVMLGGVSGVPKDVPPYVIASGQRARIIGLNLVGLRRNGFDQARRAHIKAVYKLVLRSGLRLAEALTRAERELPGPDTDAIVAFCRASERGITGFA
ncbi:acyl-[acyl-carrier-protein]--UDP-N-acetylglucosamine O-acyltransferase [Thiohalocapsa halophila]|uniref:Acyl-[acyl-carrier-protein]--UDP-N-acetylglucosamine O-acyltransferase n=1 Tax=Thiohalocapsa halophila TaxID=69359 RepID=A0ABS1CH39_9GAMM|nr:acyl-ACP--UDP-N-acetylglucosamine O-acyltransferase [Thiohalocapsa halophila]MBK1631231.1 acyl-[acyl-carrier-protein]--UDP-N-acetylglucosamine O-acyltransferase [Thiohalocapsa halophila]